MIAPDRRSEILVVDDDPALLDVMADQLRSAGYEVRPVGSAEEARLALDAGEPDLVVLDLVLPDADGVVFCQALRERSDVPIVIVSGTRRKNDAILGLHVGADDFIGKPFDLYEFTARVGAVLRRAGRRVVRASARGDYELDPTRQGLRVGRDFVPLTPREYRTLATLAEQPGRVVTHAELAEAVWGRPLSELGRAVDTQLRRLRRKLADLPAAPLVRSAHGRGYRLLTQDEGEREPADGGSGQAPPGR